MKAGKDLHKKMEKSLEIIIKGMVLGVGLRPHIHRMAAQHSITGCLQATHAGIHLHATGRSEDLEAFLDAIRHGAPGKARIEEMDTKELPLRPYNGFIEKTAEKAGPVESPLPPDFALCPHCRKELEDKNSRRHVYPYISCPDCGPRYSILSDWPFARENSSFALFEPCVRCQAEYHDPENRRYRYPLISCPECGPGFHLYDCRSGEKKRVASSDMASVIADALKKGKTVAVKDTGGYLLLADAGNARAVKRLRERKHEHQKPLALVYPSAKETAKDTSLSPEETALLESPEAPIVILNRKEKPKNRLAFEAIAPGLKTLGVMLPTSGLMQLIINEMQGPIVATSANHAGSQILYTNEEAFRILPEYCDFIASHELTLQVPQDDSVLILSPEKKEKIIRRRGRGLAPNYPVKPFHAPQLSGAALGSDMKSAFALFQKNRIYLSQYLGNQASEEARMAFRKCILHLARLLDFTPNSILLDNHPDAFSTEMGRQLGEHRYPFDFLPHHRAHFASILADHGLFNQKVLGMVWDGYGWGEDDTIWGGETFLYEKKKIRHVAQLTPYELLDGRSMVLEPRLSAFCLFGFIDGAEIFLHPLFSEDEWQKYQTIRQHGQCPFTTSMGRIFDAVSAILHISTSANRYEGEAALKLEQAAIQAREKGLSPPPYHIDWNKEISFRPMLGEIIIDIRRGKSPEEIALRFHFSLAHLIIQAARDMEVQHIALAGGVFQNSLLPDLLHEIKDEHMKLYFARYVAPNDESIALGQIILHLLKKYPEAFDL